MSTDQELSASLAAHGRDLAHWVSPGGKVDPEWIAKARSLLPLLQEELSKAAGDGGPPIGSQHAFPAAIAWADPSKQGMTYRQWLIGQALRGVLSHPVIGTYRDEAMRLQVTSRAIEAADSVCAALDMETLDKKIEEKGDAEAP